MDGTCLFLLSPRLPPPIPIMVKASGSEERIRILMMELTISPLGSSGASHCSNTDVAVEISLSTAGGLPTAPGPMKIIHDHQGDK